MAAIVAENLTKRYQARVKAPGLKASVRALVKPEYRTVDAVKGVSFSVDEGEMLAFIGPNGAGKSTTIKLLTGILHASGGSASVLGLNPQAERAKLAYQIGAVFGQKSQLWFHLPAADSFDLLAAIYDIPAAEAKRRTAELAERFELGEFFRTPVRKLSLGQRVRCEVAASLLHRPRLLFLDEPTIGLDVVVKRQIRSLVVEMNREYGATVFLTSHDAGDVEQLCRRAIVIDKGEIVLDESVDALRHAYFQSKAVVVTYETGERETLTVNTAHESVDEVMRALFARGAVRDVTVEDPPMERVIEDIFRKGAAGE